MTFDISHRGFRRGELYAYECLTCGKDTPHRQGACVYCKTPTQIEPKAKKERESEISSKLAKTDKRAWFRRHNAALRYYDRNRALIQNARKKAFHEAAERSRQMFEGKGK